MQAARIHRMAAPGLSLVNRHASLASVSHRLVNPTNAQISKNGTRSFWSFSRGFGKSLQELACGREQQSLHKQETDVAETHPVVEPLRAGVCPEQPEMQHTSSLWVSSR